MKRLHPEKMQSYCLPEPKDICMSKLEGGHVSLDNCTAATAASDNIAAYIKLKTEKVFQKVNESRVKAGLEALPNKIFNVYFSRCHNHLRCTCVDNTRKEINSYMEETFQNELEEIKSEFPNDMFTLDINNLIRLCEKFYG